MPVPPHNTAASRWLWALAGLLLLGEFLLFDRMTSRHHASIYPRWNDQIQYLSEAYKAFEHYRANGLWSALLATLTKPAPQGMLHDFFAVQVFALVGSASRSAALSLNFLVFIAWQAATLAALTRLTASRAMGWMGFGLLLSLAGPWSGEAGSAVDFRLDHAAMCLFGLAATTALLTQGFRSLGWSLVFGTAVGVTLLQRFLTGAYFAAIFLAAALWILAGANRRPRLRNLLLAGSVAALLAGPIFWLNRLAIYNYYWIGHVAGAEGDARVRGFDLAHSLQFVSGNLGSLHLGSWFGGTTAGLTVALLLLRALGHRPGRTWRTDWLFVALAFLLLPALVLSLHRQKSEIVLGILVPGATLLIFWLWAVVWDRIDWARTGSWGRIGALTLAIGAVGTGGHFFTKRQLTAPHTAEFQASARQVTAIADHIFTAARHGQITHPNIAVDQVVDFLDAQILQVICYERQKVWVPFVIQLPDSILASPDEVILYRLKLCDFVMLTDDMPGNGHWPYDQQMRRLYPELKTWCEAQLHSVDTFTLFGRHMSLYQRLPVP